MKRVSFKRALVASATLLALIIGQETWALAGTTGGLAGYVKDSSNGAPIAGVRIQAVSPSQTASTITDAGGHFIMQSLAPDSYTLNLSKDGYQTASFPGEVVFADQTQQSALTLQRGLKTIGHVTATTSGSLVKSGVGGDLYNVTAAQAAAAAPLGGGSNLNSAYSAMASVPGVQVNVGGAGWDFNAAYVRGQNSYYTGFEYDAIPINRAFDNYNASTESSLGLQELQVYTGGGPASVSTSGTAGFINQVIKTGTFPGYGIASFGTSTNAFYASAQAEVGGATPDRNFTYYAAFAANNQGFRLLDSQNGADLMVPGGSFSGPTLGAGIGYTGCTTFTCQGVKPSCALLASPQGQYPQGCWSYYNGISAAPSQITDRENVVNLHLGIPRRNGLRDDVQMLWSGSALNNYFYSSPNDIGTSYQQFSWSEYGAPYGTPQCNQPITLPVGLTVTGCKPAPGTAYAPYADGVAYNLPFGTTVATPGHTALPSIYYAPDTPLHQYLGPIPLFDQSISPLQNDTGITKLQYTHALSSAAYVRAYGYTFYSDWLQESPLFGSTGQGVPSVPPAQYQLITHTVGGALEFNDQINDQNQLAANVNFDTASVIRFNNSSGIAGANISPIGYMSARTATTRATTPLPARPNRAYRPGTIWSRRRASFRSRRPGAATRTTVRPDSRRRVRLPPLPGRRGIRSGAAT